MIFRIFWKELRMESWSKKSQCQRKKFWTLACVRKSLYFPSKRSTHLACWNKMLIFIIHQTILMYHVYQVLKDINIAYHFKIQIHVKERRDAQGRNLLCITDISQDWKWNICIKNHVHKNYKQIWNTSHCFTNGMS